MKVKTFDVIIQLFNGSPICSPIIFADHEEALKWYIRVIKRKGFEVDLIPSNKLEEDNLQYAVNEYFEKTEFDIWWWHNQVII